MANKYSDQDPNLENDMNQEELTPNLIDETSKVANEVSDAVRSASKVASKAASGNVVGAAKEALKNNKFKKAIKRKIIKYIAMIIIPIILAAAFFGIATKMKDELVTLLVNIGTNTKGFISNLMHKINKATGQEYWIKLDDSDTTYIIDIETGDTLAYKDESGQEILTDREKLAELVKRQWRRFKKS